MYTHTHTHTHTHTPTHLEDTKKKDVRLPHGFGKDDVVLRVVLEDGALRADGVVEQEEEEVARRVPDDGEYGKPYVSQRGQPEVLEALGERKENVGQVLFHHDGNPDADEVHIPGREYEQGRDHMVHHHDPKVAAPLFDQRDEDLTEPEGTAPKVVRCAVKRGGGGRERRRGGWGWRARVEPHVSREEGERESGWWGWRATAWGVESTVSYTS